MDRELNVTYFWVSGGTTLSCLITSALSLKVPKSQRPKALKIDAFDYPTVVCCTLSGEPANIRITLYCQKPEFLAYISAADSIRLSLFVLVLLSPKATRKLWTQNKVTYFQVSRKLTRDWIRLYHNVGLISTGFKVKASENIENCRFRPLHCRLTPLYIGSPREYTHKPYIARNYPCACILKQNA